MPAARLADPAMVSAALPLQMLLSAVTLLVAGIPFRLSLQYWRFAAIGDLVTVVASAAVGAGLFAVVASLMGLPSSSAAFPIIHALTLLALLGAPRVLYRWVRGRRALGQTPADASSVLLVGGIEDQTCFCARSLMIGANRCASKGFWHRRTDRRGGGSRDVRSWVRLRTRRRCCASCRRKDVCRVCWSS